MLLITHVLQPLPLLSRAFAPSVSITSGRHGFWNETAWTHTMCACPSLAYVIAIIFHLLIKYVVGCCSFHLEICCVPRSLTRSHCNCLTQQNDKNKQHEIANDEPMLMVLTRKYARLNARPNAAATTVFMRLVHLIKQIKRTVCIQHVRITFDVVICVYLCNLTLHADKNRL